MSDQDLNRLRLPHVSLLVVILVSFLFAGAAVGAVLWEEAKPPEPTPVIDTVGDQEEVENISVLNDTVGPNDPIHANAPDGAKVELWYPDGQFLADQKVAMNGTAVLFAPNQTGTYRVMAGSYDLGDNVTVRQTEPQIHIEDVTCDDPARPRCEVNIDVEYGGYDRLRIVNNYTGNQSGKWAYVNDNGFDVSDYGGPLNVSDASRIWAMDKSQFAVAVVDIGSRNEQTYRQHEIIGVMRVNASLSNNYTYQRFDKHRSEWP